MQYGKPVYLAALVLFSLAGEASATSIVMLRSPTKVYVGADSRRSYHDAQGSYGSSVCKIVPAGRFWFLASGLTYADHQQVADIGIQAGRGSASVEQAMEEFRGRVAGYLPKALAAREELDATPPGSLVLEAAFVGFENGRSMVSVEWFRSIGEPATPGLTSDRQTYSARVSGYDFIYLGKRQAIDRYMNGRTRSIRGDFDAAQLIRRLISFEIDASPDTTAGPIDILRLTPSGFLWLNAKPGCDYAPGH